MTDFFEFLMTFLKRMGKNQFPAVYGLLRIALDYKALSISWTARMSRRFGSKAIFIVGLIASLYAGFLSFNNSIAPNAPKPSHDVILKTRFSSPKPSHNVVILDIDERSLATLSEEYGRWPWARSVLADGMQKASDSGARGLLLNVMLSDPDRSNADADAVMDMTAQMIRPSAFPIIRLNPENDKLSQLRVSTINGAKLIGDGEPTLAAILPMFQSMHDRLGVANQKPDDDGIIRKYAFVWDEEKFSLPSIVKRSLEAADADVIGVPHLISLNWRNKEGRYFRMSFTDLLAASPDDPKLSVFKNSMVVLGLSAPGLGQTKATAVLPVEDDSEILATAIDDALNGTYLRLLPEWCVLSINLIAIWTLVFLATTKTTNPWFNKIFFLAQSGLGSVTLLSASYTNYLVDLTDSMTFGAGVFTAIKLVQSLDNSWTRAKPGFRRISKRDHFGSLVLVGYLNSALDSLSAKALENSVQKIVGMPRFIRIDDLFSGESFVMSNCAKCRVLVILADDQQFQALITWIEENDSYQNIVINRRELESKWDPDDPIFQAELAPVVLKICIQILETIEPI